GGDVRPHPRAAPLRSGHRGRRPRCRGVGGMRILVLGGTVFVGRHIVDAALARGHEVTLFHRGRHPSHRPGDVAEVLGDRTRDLDALDGSWDAVVDTSGYLPADVAAAAAALGPRSERYVFISSASVYADLSTTPVTEDAPTH